MMSYPEMRETQAFKLGKKEGVEECQKELAKRLLLSGKFDHMEIAQLSGLPKARVVAIHGTIKHGWPTDPDSPEVIYVEDLLGNDDLGMLAYGLMSVLAAKVKSLEEEIDNGPEWKDMLEKAFGSIEMAEFMIGEGNFSTEAIKSVTGLSEEQIQKLKEKLASSRQ